MFLDVVYQSAGEWSIQGSMAWRMAQGICSHFAVAWAAAGMGCGSVALESLYLPGGRVWPDENEGGGRDLCVLPNFISREIFCAAMAQKSALSKLYTPEPRAPMNVHNPHSLISFILRLLVREPLARPTKNVNLQRIHFPFNGIHAFRPRPGDS